MKAIQNLLAFLTILSTHTTQAFRADFNNDTFISGYIPIDNGEESLYFIMAESRGNPLTDPLIIWLQGGPGCSSEFAMFTENGPYNFKFDKHHKPAINLTYNEWSWNNRANVIYLD